jgi:hypothetical protein
MSRSFGHRRLVLLLCAVALGAYHIFASSVMFPVPGGDAVVFMPAAINLKAGSGLNNYLWTGRQRFVEHPPLFQMVVSACMWKSDTRNAFIVLAIFNALTLSLFAAILGAAKFSQKLIASRMGFIVLISSLFALAFLIFTASGRPETLSTLVLTLAIAVITWLPQKCWPVCLGIAIGVAAAIHPTHGVFIACLVVLTFVLTDPVRQAIRKMVLSAAIALPLFWLLLSLGPYPVEEVLRTLAWHAGLAAGPDYRLSTLAFYYFKLAPWSGVYLLGLVLVLIWCGIHIWRGADDRMMRWARLAALFLAASIFWYSSIRRPNASYYLIMLAPALAAGALYLFGVRNRPDDRRLKDGPFLILAAFFGIFSLCLARDVALFVDYRTAGVSFTSARKNFHQLLSSTDQVISVSESLWVLTDEFERISIVERGTTSGDLMVLQQTQRGSLFPPVIPGYRLLSQNFVSHPPKWFAFPIARTTPGYSFAVFAREIQNDDS